MQLNSSMRTKEELIEKQRIYIDRVCEQLGITYTELARKIDVSQSTITRLFSDKNNHALSATTLDKVSRHFNVEPFHYVSNQVVLIGIVGALAKVTLYPDIAEIVMVEAPPEAVRAKARALRIENDDNWPVYKKDEILYIINDSSPLNPKLDYLIELETGETLIRMIQPGTFEGVYTLIWHNAPPIMNVKIKSASPIKWTKKF